jgi:outer membrane protein assembly factor BamB
MSGFIEASPVVREGVVYDVSQDGMLYAVRENDGRTIWKVPVPEYGRLALAGHFVVVTTLAEDEAFAFATASGRRAWVVPVGAPEAANFEPTVSGTDIFTSSGESVARLTAAGHVVWRRLLKEESFEIGSPAVDRAGVYFAAWGRFQKLDRRTGRRMFSVPIRGERAEAIAVTHGTAYLLIATKAYGPRRLLLEARTTSTGALVWRTELGNAKWIGKTLMLALDGRAIYAAAADGNLYSIDRARGTIRWRAALEPVASSPLLANGIVYVVDGTGTLIASDARDGKRLWSASVNGSVPNPSSPTLVNGTLIVGTASGSVAFRAAVTGH